MNSCLKTKFLWKSSNFLNKLWILYLSLLKSIFSFSCNSISLRYNNYNLRKNDSLLKNYIPIHPYYSVDLLLHPFLYFHKSRLNRSLTYYYYHYALFCLWFLYDMYAHRKKAYIYTINKNVYIKFTVRLSYLNSRSLYLTKILCNWY